MWKRVRSKRFCLLGAASALSLTLIACGRISSSHGGKTPAADGAPDAKSALAASATQFAQVDSYQLKFDGATSDHVDGFSGVAAYRAGKAVFAQTDLTGSSTMHDNFTRYLFLPPDLYFQRRDGNWFVQSPWNQGYRPGQLQSLGIEAPVVQYDDLTGALNQVERRGDEILGSKRVTRYSGRVATRDLPLLAGSGGPIATVDIWLDDAGLPARAELAVNDATGFRITIDFDEYNSDVIAPPAPPSAGPLRDVNFPDAPCIGDALADCLKAQSGLVGAETCAGSGRRVCLVPLGNVSPDLVEQLVSYYRQQYSLAVTVLTPKSIPADLEEPLRKQIDASRLITYMGDLFPDAYRDPSAVLIGLTPVDLYDSTSHFRYLFGLKGTPADPKAVVSSLRMDPRFYSAPEDQELYFSRARKLLSKYIGLLYYRLPTSGDPASAMFDSILGPDDVDRMTGSLPVN